MISYISEDQEVDPGTTALFRCIVDDPSTDTFPVMWRKAGKTDDSRPKGEIRLNMEFILDNLLSKLIFYINMYVF